MRETGGVERFYEWLYRRLGSHYLAGIMAIDVASALLITLGTLGILRLYVDATTAEFLRIVAFAELAVLLGVVFIIASMWPVVRPVRRWLDGDRSQDPAEVWRTALALPLQFVRRADRQGVFLVALPVSVFAVVELSLPFYSVLFLLLGGLVSIGYRRSSTSSTPRWRSARCCATSPKSSRRTSQPRSWACRCAGSCSARCR